MLGCFQKAPGDRHFVLVPVRRRQVNSQPFSKSSLFPTQYAWDRVHLMSNTVGESKTWAWADKDSVIQTSLSNFLRELFDTATCQSLPAEFPVSRTIPEQLDHRRRGDK